MFCFHQLILQNGLLACQPEGFLGHNLKRREIEEVKVVWVD